MRESEKGLKVSCDQRGGKTESYVEELVTMFLGPDQHAFNLQVCASPRHPRQYDAVGELLWINH